jgi:hypothetical protein
MGGLKITSIYLLHIFLSYFTILNLNKNLPMDYYKSGIICPNINNKVHNKFTINLTLEY